MDNLKVNVIRVDMISWVVQFFYYKFPPAILPAQNSQSLTQANTYIHDDDQYILSIP